MRETVTVNQKEQARIRVVAEVERGRMTVTQAAESMNLSVRQTHRILAAFRKEGAAGVAHGNRGRQPEHTIGEEELLDAIPPIRRPRGRPRRRPAKVHADKAYDLSRCRQALQARYIKVRIARKGVESREKLGRHRWVVERTLAWFDQFRRLTIRYERRVDIHEAFLSLGCSLICFNALHRFC